ncbi:hypothetical protein DTO96_100905 [Ephemeroptericola cinctiostellae]|uniref:Uncharacterized protein n=1 Tax=Ephemeroptericola cinctiostellae TaxID=2268024 RepID=A0A345D9Z2_9BURK|nr:hypothetical protein [Ephemeroptericola cinctiostellae]AXF85180.1 hypothetical protein DTO96_100905 [Ephemeroptericola cinctiostellae]
MHLSWDNDPRWIKSFSELEQRNYNPSIAISNHISQDDEEGWGNSEFADALNVFNINREITLPKALSDEDRKQWVASGFEDITSFLSQQFDGKTWICLLGNWDAEEAKDFGEDNYGLSAEAKMSQWTHIRAMTTPSKGHQKILSNLRTERFFGNGIQLAEDRQAWISEYPWKSTFTQIEEGCAQNDSFWRNKNDKYSGVSLLSCDIANILLPNPAMYRGVKSVLGFLSAPILNSENNTIEIRDQNNLPVFVSVLGKNRMLLIEQDSLLKWLSADKLTFFWCGLSEKMAYSYSKHEHVGGIANQGAIYKLQSKDKIIGGFIGEQYEHTHGAD